METIKYQGQEMPAEKIGELGGYMGSLRGRERNGEDQLWRDEEGYYYVRQRRYTATKGGPQYMAEAEDAGVLFETIHRVGLNAAILWAISTHGHPALELRLDARDLIMEDRGYSDPLDPYDRYIKEKGSRHPAPPEIQPAGKTSPSFQLDNRASALLGEYLADHPQRDARDVVNGALQYMLSDEARFPDCVDDAQDRRQSKATPGEAPTERPIFKPVTATRQAVGEIIMQLRDNPPGEHRFTFIYPATEERCGLSKQIVVDDEQMTLVSGMAKEFGLEPDEFLYVLVIGALPGQPGCEDGPLPLADLLMAEHIGFTCLDAAMAARIERTAKARNQTVDEFVAHALGSDVDMWEEDMLVHPMTGKLLHPEGSELYTKLREAITAAPIGREDDPQFQMHHGRKYVRFGAYLTPEQLERLEFPHMVSDCNTDEEVPTLLVPFDAEACPFLEVDGQRVKIGQLLSPAAETEEAA